MSADNSFLDVLHFWFGELSHSAAIPDQKTSMWFADGKDYDGVIREKFGQLHQRACLGSWMPGSMRVKVYWLLSLPWISFPGIFTGKPHRHSPRMPGASHWWSQGLIKDLISPCILSSVNSFTCHWCMQKTLICRTCRSKCSASFEIKRRWS